MASFISSLLSSVVKDENTAKSTSSKVRAAGPIAPAAAVVGQKRKAETELERNGDKVQKVANGDTRRDIKPLPRRADVSSNGASTKVSAETTMRSLDKYGGTSAAAASSRSTPRPEPAVSKTITVKSTTSRPLSSSGTNLPGAKSANSAKPVMTKPAQKPPPKAGSFKAMLAKAKESAAKQTLGQIVHKPTEHVSLKKQMAQAKAEVTMKGKGNEKSASKPGLASKQGVSRPTPDKKTSTSTYQGTARPAPSKPQSTYQGTARPTTKPVSSYRGTARPNTAPANRGLSKPGKSRNANEYLDTDESEPDYDDDRYDNAEEADDDPSDMDAGFDDLDEEEREAERQAKLDDAREQRQLEKLAKEKALRKASRG